MSRLISFLLLSSLMACVNAVPVVTVPPPPEPEPKPTLEMLMATSASEWPKTGWHGSYDLVIDETLKIAPITKLPCFKGAAVFRAMAKAESGFNRETMYMEPAPLFKYSIGLLQLSYTDQKNYGLNCGWSNEEDLKHPIRNLYCGVRILSALEKKNPTLNFYQYGGKYWSVLRYAPYWPGKSQSGVERFRAELLKACI